MDPGAWEWGGTSLATDPGVCKLLLLMGSYYLAVGVKAQSTAPVTLTADNLIPRWFGCVSVGFLHRHSPSAEPSQQ